MRVPIDGKSHGDSNDTLVMSETWPNKKLWNMKKLLSKMNEGYWKIVKSENEYNEWGLQKLYICIVNYINII